MDLHKGSDFDQQQPESEAGVWPQPQDQRLFLFFVLQSTQAPAPLPWLPLTKLSNLEEKKKKNYSINENTRFIITQDQNKEKS